MKVIVCKAPPQAQHADSQVGENTTHRPNNSVYGNLLKERVINCVKITKCTHVVLLLKNVHGGENKFEHQVDCVDNYE